MMKYPSLTNNKFNITLCLLNFANFYLYLSFIITIITRYIYIFLVEFNFPD